MTASFIAQITDDMIQAKIDQIDSYALSYIGRLSDAEQWRDAVENMPLPTVAEVRAQLSHELCGDSADDEIGMAISMAMEPEELPENACVEVEFLAEGKSLRPFAGR